MWQNSQRPSIGEHSIANINIPDRTNWVGVDTNLHLYFVNHIEVCLARF